MNIKIFTLRDAFFKDIEIMFGYLSMGCIFGILLKASGFGAFYAFIMSAFIYSGVMQFLAISFFSGSLGLVNIFITTLMINIRQSFYTLIMTKDYRKMDWKRFLNIFWLTDETFALLKTKLPHPNSDKNLFVFFVGMLNYIYWITGCVLGTLISEILDFDKRGIEFIMPAIFIVIFIEQWKNSKTHIPALLGIFIAIFWLIVVGEKYFLILSIITSILLFTIFRNFLKI